MRGKPRLVKLQDSTGNLKSPYWYIAYFDGGRSCRQTTGCRVGEEDDAAETYFHTWCLERERPIAREPDKLMVAQALKDYITEHAAHTATAKHAKYHEARLNGFFGDRAVGDITQGKINEYTRSRQAKGESNGTIRRDLEVLKAALNHEERERRLTYVPKFSMPPAPQPRGKILTESQVKSLIKACKSQHVKDFIILMMETGQRPGAIEQLKWFQIDFKEGVIGFDMMGRRQSNKRVRPVPMSEEARALLKRLYKIKKTEYVLEFTDTMTGEVRKAGCVKKAFDRACKDTGMEGVSRYTLRHTFANNDMDDYIKQQFMGHTNVKTTREHYIKVNIPKMREALKQRKLCAKPRKVKS